VQAHAFHFQHVPKVSVAVSNLSYINIIFTKHGAKSDRQYCREVLLMQELLPLLEMSSREKMHQHTALMKAASPPHMDEHELLCRETPHSLLVICGQPPLLPS